MYLAQPKKAHDLRKFYADHTKTDITDAEALARMPLRRGSSALRAAEVSSTVERWDVWILSHRPLVSASISALELLREHLDKAIGAFTKVGRELGVIE